MPYPFACFVEYSLWLQPGNPPGMATLTSPAYSTTHTKICLRLTYRLALYVAVEIFTKSYRIGDGAAVIKKIITLTQNISPFTDKDMLMDVSSSFQVLCLFPLFDSFVIRWSVRVAEWLRRSVSNRLGFTRVGSNPVIGTTNNKPTADSAVYLSEVSM